MTSCNPGYHHKYSLCAHVRGTLKTKAKVKKGLPSGAEISYTVCMGVSDCSQCPNTDVVLCHIRVSDRFSTGRYNLTCMLARR